jgi:hypothetical protein
MTVDQLLKEIEATLRQLCDQRHTGRIDIRVTLNQGGIRNAEMFEVTRKGQL